MANIDFSDYTLAELKGLLFDVGTLAFPDRVADFEQQALELTIGVIVQVDPGRAVR